MSNPMIYHESELSALLDIMNKIVPDNSNKPSVNKSKPAVGSSSIAKATSKLTLTFPVICSRGIAIENSAMVTKALERNFVTMIQQLLAANNISNFEGLQDYIDTFHNNIDSTIMNFDDILNMMENAFEYVTPKDIAVIKESMRYIDASLPSAVNETALTDFTVREGAVEPNKKDKNNNGITNIAKDNSTVNNNITNTNINIDNDKSKNAKSSAEFFNKQVLDSDYKKANELMPTMLAVNFKVKTDNAGLQDYGNAVIGVKAKLYPISSNDIVSHVIDKVTGNANWLVNILKVITREISVSSFVKDFVLAIDKAKMDAATHSSRHSSGASKMWGVLERRAVRSKTNRMMRNSNSAAAAITTLCISQEEVEYIKKNSSPTVDLESLSVVKGLFESYNLICICIVDEALEVAKFVFDTNDPTWEVIPFTHLERESSDNTYKRVVNLIAKTSH